jgi:predicted RNA methylase
VYDRAFLLSASKRNDVLGLDEVLRYGSDSFGDADYVSLYGLAPADWYARGVRVLGRTAVECTRDVLAARIARDVAAVAGAGPAVVVDPFAGSANTLFWLARRLRAARAIGCELDPGVFEATVRNLAAVGFDADLRRVGYEVGLGEIAVSDDELLVVFVAPPWGDALDPEHGLDLRRTQPPVTDVVDVVARTFASRRVLVAIQVHETATADSLTDVRSRFGWSRLAIYELDPPGRNHGIVLGALGWDPDADA